MTRHQVVDGRYRGLPGIALGGYVGGMLAGASATPRSLEVVFSRPVPVGVPVTMDPGAGGRVRLRLDDEGLAGGSPWAGGLELPEPIAVEQADEASQRFLGRPPHGFAPQLACFCCGPARRPADGLRIFPGLCAGSSVVAAPWTPHQAQAGPDGVVPTEIVWSALDCPAIWAMITSAPPDSDEAVVSGTIATGVIGEVHCGQPLVAMGWPVGTAGRKRWAGAAVFSAEGEPLAEPANLRRGGARYPARCPAMALRSRPRAPAGHRATPRHSHVTPSGWSPGRGPRDGGTADGTRPGQRRRARLRGGGVG